MVILLVSFWEILFYLVMGTTIALVYIHWISFIEILGFVMIVELFKRYILPICTITQHIQGPIIPEEKSNMICETFKALTVEVVQSTIVEENNGALKDKQEPKQKKNISIVRSITVHQFCEALGIETELNPGAEFESFKQQKKIKTKRIITVVLSMVAFKFCEALDIKYNNIKCTLAASSNNLK
ncbi:hypothetical protein NPIL_552221 [Nephila pilipes]|uniref:Uncharacterized protein n=1 Tax=Nephila pilipes TaxID=299642 RepID=A0A8X6NH33_NEPPI|nr:hypothetical protein NPIL_552221 [Nephila pilipes]